MSNPESSQNFPVELSDPVAEFDSQLSELSSKLIEPLTSTSRTELLESLSPAQKAKLDLISAFTLNSLAWIWLKTQGQDPKDTEVKK